MIRKITLLIMVLAAFVLLNYYILRRTGDLWGYKPRTGFHLLLVYCCVSYIVTSVMERYVPSLPVSVLHALSGLWLGIGMISLVCLASYDLVNLIVKLDASVFRWAILAVTVSISVYAIARSLMLEVKTINIDSDLRIVQLSDIHIGSVSNRHLKRIINKTNEARPDVVLITGDLADTHTRLTDETLEILNTLNAPAFFVSGNHERYAGYHNVIEKLKRTKIKVLDNESVFFKGIQIIGISDDENDGALKQWIETFDVDSRAFTILMMHRPLHLETASKKGIDLMLSGHTHNGQIFPFNYLVKMRYKYIQGLFHNARCKLYVTSGTGTWGPKMRLGSTNEIVVFEPVR